jgi:Zn-dependent metalloprotease
MSNQSAKDISLDSKSTQLKTIKGLAHQDSISKLTFKKEQYSVKLISREIDSSGKLHTKFTQTYNGIPVWGRNIIQHQKNNVKSKGLLSLNTKNTNKEKFTGELITNLPNDLANLKPAAGFTEAEALNLAKQLYAQENKINATDKLFYENEKSELVIFTHNADGKAKLVYKVSFFVDDIYGNNPARPSYIIDATTKNIIKNWNALMHDRVGTGPGGNEKIGKYNYGVEMPKLDLREAPRGECFMTSSKVRTVNLNKGYYGAKTNHFRCYESNFDAVNGAYSPLNDAHYYGEQIFNMYRDWYDKAPLTFKLLMRVHYGKNYENAFWNGSSMTFGDGRDYFYPLVSMDVAAHEVSHGFTEQNSNLEYMDQSGGINESFSDMAGKAGEYYVFGKNTWGIGIDITKGNEPLRYLDNPEKDSISIGDARDYNDWLDVHYSSGVFNKAFYLLATHDNWNIKKAFDVFVHANMYYWTPMSDYIDGALGAVYSAEDLGYIQEHVIDVFRQVGIACDSDSCKIMPEDRKGKANNNNSDDDAEMKTSDAGDEPDNSSDKNPDENS